MPRGRVLTDEQLESLFALSRTEPVLIRHWTLDEADLAAIARRRGGGNRLGYALQLCTFRYPGRLLRPGEVLPQPALDFVAEQIHVTAGELASYTARRQTRQEQLDEQRETFGLRMYGADQAREISAWLLPVALATTDIPGIAATLMDEFRRRRDRRSWADRHRTARRRGAGLGRASRHRATDPRAVPSPNGSPGQPSGVGTARCP